MKEFLLVGLTMALASTAQAQSVASLSYSPTWQARHHLQLLADGADLPLTVSHWPLPADAVQRALDGLVLPEPSGALAVSRDFVLRELAARREQGRVQWHVRSKSEGLTGFAESYTPGSSVEASSAEGRWAGDGLSVAGRLGARLEAQPNSMPAHLPGVETDSRSVLSPVGSEAVMAWSGWNVQIFARQNWWGPGWQSSLVNGHNSPAWLGVGVQRGAVQASDSGWLSWMGPWNLDVFVAKAQDPQVVLNQPSGFLFSGMRLTMKPRPWLEVGLSRGLQTGGAGRPGGMTNFAKAFFGQQVNQNPGDPPDTSGQIAGYDVRVRCPAAWGSCAAYTQWMGEDAAGRVVPLPFKFMSLWGLEKTYDEGRYRVFAEWTDANAYSLPWDTKPSFPGYVNGVYSQGYTQGARWLGAAQGAGSRVLTLGWMDAQLQRQLKLHTGEIFSSLGAYSPTRNAPHGRMWGLSASQSIPWRGMMVTPELAYTRLASGEDQGANKRVNLRAGLMLSMPL